MGEARNEVSRFTALNPNTIENGHTVSPETLSHPAFSPISIIEPRENSETRIPWLR